MHASVKSDYTYSHFIITVTQQAINFTLQTYIVYQQHQWKLNKFNKNYLHEIEVPW